MLAYALVLPALHLVVGLTGVLGEETARARDMVVLGALVAFLLLALARQRGLRPLRRRSGAAVAQGGRGRGLPARGGRRREPRR